jgi:hypothetical protein
MEIPAATRKLAVGPDLGEDIHSRSLQCGDFIILSSWSPRSDPETTLN